MMNDKQLDALISQPGIDLTITHHCYQAYIADKGWRFMDKDRMKLIFNRMLKAAIFSHAQKQTITKTLEQLEESYT